MGLRGPPPDHERIARIRHWRSLGMSYKTIGTMLGISRQRVQHIIAPAALNKYKKKRRDSKKALTTRPIT